MELDVPSNDARSSATIDFVVDNLSRMKTKDAIFSEPCMIRNLPWKILVMKKGENESSSLGFFIQCNGESDSLSWSCSASATLLLLSRRNGVDDFERKISHEFDPEENDWGFSLYMLWNKVLNPESGYIKNNSIILRAKIHTHPPTDVNFIPVPLPLTSESEEEMDYDELASACKESDTKIQSLEAEVSQLKKDLTAAKSSIKTVCGELNTTSVELLASKISILEEMLKSKFEDIEKKFNDFSNQLGKEKRVGVDVNVIINGAESNNSSKE